MSIWKGNNQFINISDIIVQEKQNVQVYSPVFTVESSQDVFGFCLAVELNCHRDFWMQWSINSYHPLRYVRLQVWGKSDSSLKTIFSGVSLRQIYFWSIQKQSATLSEFACKNHCPGLDYSKNIFTVIQMQICRYSITRYNTKIKLFGKYSINAHRIK